MAVKLRLRRLGRKKSPFYQLVAADSRSPRDGRFIENVGTYNPVLTTAPVTLKADRVRYWLSVGAQPTDTVRNILSREGIFLQMDLEKNGADAEAVETRMGQFAADRAARAEARAAKKKIRKPKSNN